MASDGSVIFAVGHGDYQTPAATSSVARIDPQTLSIERIFRHPRIEGFSLATTAIQIGEEIWLGTNSGEMIAYFPAISEFPKGRKYLISLSFRGKASVRPAQVGGFDVNIVIHGSTAVRGRGDLVAYRWALWKLTAPWTHRTRPPHLGKRCAFSTSSTGPFPSNHSRKTPKGPKIALGNPDRPYFPVPRSAARHRVATPALCRMEASTRARQARMSVHRVAGSSGSPSMSRGSWTPSVFWNIVSWV